MGFGVVIVCSEKDFSLAKGCLASVKYFMPYVDTCLLVDGNVDTRMAENVYGCKVIKKSDVKDEFLRNNSFGWSITKMIALWESPFENFLLLDADVCVWGDIVSEVNWIDYDVILDQPQYTFEEKDINTWFFNLTRLREIDPDFIPGNFKNNFCCPGVYFFKRGIFNVNWYQELTILSKKEPGLFKFGDMGMFNYMVLKSFQEGKITVKNQYIQHICPDFEKSETRKMFPIKDNTPKVVTSKAIHYNGDWKPYMKNPLCYHQPMTFFRELYHKTVYPEFSKIQIRNIMKREDMVFEKKITFNNKLKNLIRPLIKPIYKQFKQAVGK